MKIKAKIITPQNTHDIVLPLNQNDFDKSLIRMGFYRLDHDQFTVEDATSGTEELDKALIYARDIEELNFLAKILDQMDTNEMELFIDVISDEGNTMAMPQIVNAAYNVKNGNFNVEPSIHDLEDLGTGYADGCDPDTDEIMMNNTSTDGEIDYEGIGVDIQLSSGGVFSGSGYISNFDEMVNNPYDGKYFPRYIDGDSYSILGVTLTKRGEEKGIDIFLPASDGVIARAGQRIGIPLDKCSMKLSWRFPATLSGKLVPALAYNSLNSTAHKLSVLTPNQLHDLFEMANNAEISIKREFEEFCSEKIQQFVCPDAVNSMTYYFPLDVSLSESDDYGELYRISSSDAVNYVEDILEQITIDNDYFETNRLLAEYFDTGSTLHQKIYSMLPSVEEHGRELWGSMVMKTTGALTKAEEIELKDYITGQNSDGYGEGLEQRAIRVSDGEIYVSFWSSEKGYAVYTQDEFDAKMGKRQAASSSTPPKAATNDLPDCPLIGADSNVFNLIGLASRALKDNGMQDQAKEMSERVKSSGSFDEALAIITEYVNPVTQDDVRQSGGFGMKM